jgi:hypothetical protein
MQANSSLFLRFNSRPAAERRRAPLLERLLARALVRRRQAGWRAHAYASLSSEPLPGLAAAALAGADESASRVPAGGTSTRPWVYFASPVHHTAGMSSVSLSADAILRLEPDEAQALAMDFTGVFGATGLRLVTAPPRLYLVFPSPVRADTHDPEAAVQGDLWEFQPGGPDGAYLRGLMSEMELWLFDHPINRARLERGAPAVTGLWLWGGGPSLPAVPVISGWTAGDDPFFAAFAAADGVREPDMAGGADPGVIVVDACPGTAAWDQAESRWLRPALARLRSGALNRLELSAGPWLFGVDAGWRWRIWRKPLPWWEQLS